MGSDFVVFMYNEDAHIGAVAVCDYDYKEEGTSCSMIPRLGYKDDVIADDGVRDYDYIASLRRLNIERVYKP